MKTKRLVEILLGASLLVGAAGCPCPDGHMEEEAQAARAEFQSQIDRCVASDADCEALCRAVFELDPGALVEKCVIRSLDNQVAHVETKYFQQVSCVGGRRPDGLVEPGCRSRAAGDWLAQIATIEAASITAFARLVRVLEQHGAPAALIAKTHAAMIDEVIHARLTAQLARRMGATVEAPVIAAHVPTLAELARENAVEGQVAETFGALLATCQGQLATDPEVRAVFARIAVDEARHAALAHELAPWFGAQLDDATRAEIEVARRAAIANIADGFDANVSDEDRALLGIPDAPALRAAAAHAFAMLAA
jgi:hypothetical protein